MTHNYRNRRIERPDVSWSAALARSFILIIIAIAAAIAAAAIWPESATAAPVAFESALAAAFLATMRSNAILAIRLYQRYAPEQVRRRCMMLPTCSDYAIMAIRRHGTLRGLAMTRRRLLHRCDGTFTIDYP